MSLLGRCAGHTAVEDNKMKLVPGRQNESLGKVVRRKVAVRKWGVWDENLCELRERLCEDW